MPLREYRYGWPHGDDDILEVCVCVCGGEGGTGHDASVVAALRFASLRFVSVCVCVDVFDSDHTFDPKTFDHTFKHV